MPTIPLIDVIGGTGAILTTLCWLPQALKIIRDKDTRAISLPTNVAFTASVIFWLVYGIARMDWPLISSSAVTVMLMAMIVALKLRHG
jgi:MtN3 and saliva related transmembrane protein